MGQNLRCSPATIRCKLEAYLFRGFQHQEQKQGDVLGSQLGIVAGGGDSEGLLEQIPGAFRVHADDAGGQTLKLLLQGGDGGAAQKQGALTGFQVQLKPEHFGDGNRNGVGAVYLIGLGDENISATENVGLAPYGKAGVSGADVDNLEAVVVIVGRQTFCSYRADLLAEQMHTGDVQMFDSKYLQVFCVYVFFKYFSGFIHGCSYYCGFLLKMAAILSEELCFSGMKKDINFVR